MKTKSNLINIVIRVAEVLFLIVLLAALVISSSYSVVDSKLLPNTPVPTVTPGTYWVKAKVIANPQITGGEILGYETWVTVRVTDAERNLDKGQEYNIKFHTGSIVVEKGDKLILTCWDVWDKQLFCYDDFRQLNE